MSQVDFASMTLDEAKRYFLEHRDSQEAFYAYGVPGGAVSLRDKFWDGAF